jgi:iron complex outermembrane receptor protein
MDYTNQLILTGEINDVGSYTRTNVPSSYRLGLEMNTVFAPFSFLKFNGALALSQNKIKEFNEFLDVYSSTEPYYSQQIITYKDVDLAFSPNVVASLGVVWEPFKNINVEWMSKFVSQQFLDNTAALDRSIKAFSYSNLTLNYALRHVLGKEINFGLQVNNIFNYLYANNGYTFSYLYDGQKTTENFYYPQAGRNLMCRVLFKF